MIQLTDVTAAYEKLDKYERAAVLDTADTVVEKLNALPAGYNALYTYCEFLIGSALTREMDYLIMYPMLVRIFGEANDYNAVKDKLRKEGKDGIRKVFRTMGDMLEAMDSQSQKEVLLLAVSVIFVQSRSSFGGHRYLKKFLKEVTPKS